MRRAGRDGAHDGAEYGADKQGPGLVAMVATIFRLPLIPAVLASVGRPAHLPVLAPVSRVMSVPVLCPRVRRHAREDGRQRHGHYRQPPRSRHSRCPRHELSPDVK